MASLNHFNKDLKDLTIDECALLASLPKAPSKLNPNKNNKEILKRRNWVIKRMRKTQLYNQTRRKRSIKKRNYFKYERK